MTEPTVDEWPCLTARLLALVATATQRAEHKSNLAAENLRRAERAEAKITRVRAACDEADRRGLGTDHIRAALDGTEPRRSR